MSSSNSCWFVGASYGEGKDQTERFLNDDWMTEGLIDFTFNNKPQNIDRFRNAAIGNSASAMIQLRHLLGITK